MTYIVDSSQARPRDKPTPRNTMMTCEHVSHEHFIVYNQINAPVSLEDS
jgi:hypothetical protein